ncbi:MULTISPECIES: hypothetical protein [unclassified Ruegeria]|uniref:hypothetical protein n=1 Tax=unclassified Ruegeria TaxID=2625375 RepID=UPI00148A0D9D|nr:MULTISPECIES: hypothetical protein [unclassified Ruegeria]
MTHSFLPRPYCRFDEMRRRVYFHLYPDIQDDTELKGEVQSNVEAASEAVAAHRRQLSDMGLDPDSATNWLLVSVKQKSAGQKLSKEAKSIFEDGADAKHLLSIAGKIEKGGFDPIDQFFPHWSQSLGRHITPPPPKALRSIQVQRLRAFMDTARDALYRGRISAHHKSSEGILRIEDKNIWLDDRIATMALETGQLTHSLKRFRTNLGAIDMIFDRDELNSQFPPFRNSKTQKVGRKNLMKPAIDALHKLYPNGRPDVPVKTLRTQIEGEIGREIGTSTMTKAIASAWGDRSSGSE